jgi:hypothetical protein
MLNSCESTRSADESGMLPQRPTPRHSIKPLNVPSLDFTRLQQQLEEEQYDQEQGDGVEAEEYAAGFTGAGSDGGSVNLCDAAADGSDSGSRSPRAGEHHFQGYGHQGDADGQHHQDLY